MPNGKQQLEQQLRGAPHERASARCGYRAPQTMYSDQRRACSRSAPLPRGDRPPVAKGRRAEPGSCSRVRNRPAAGPMLPSGQPRGRRGTAASVAAPGDHYFSFGAFRSPWISPEGTPVCPRFRGTVRRAGIAPNLFFLGFDCRGMSASCRLNRATTQRLGELKKGRYDGQFNSGYYFCFSR